MRRSGYAGLVALTLSMWAAAQPPTDAMPAPGSSGSASGSMSSKDAPKFEFPKKILDKGPEEWDKLIKSSDPGVREAAIKMMLVFGPEGIKVGAKNIVAAIDDRDASCRMAAANTIANGGRFEKDSQNVFAVSRLRYLCNDPQAMVRMQAIIALTTIGNPEAAAAIPELVDRGIVDSGSYEIRKAAATALGRIGQQPNGMANQRALYGLAKGLSDPAALVRREVMQSLLIVGEPANPKDREYLKEALTKHALKDKDKIVAVWSRVSLMRLDAAARTPENFARLTDGLTDPDPALARNSAHALGVCGDLAAGQVGKLIPVLDHKEPEVSSTAAWALGMIGPTASAALPRLEKMLADETAKKEKGDELIKLNAKDAIEMIKNPKK